MIFIDSGATFRKNNFSYNWIFFQKIRLKKGCQFDVFNLRKTLKIDFWLFLKKKIEFRNFLDFLGIWRIMWSFYEFKKKSINQKFNSKIQFHYILM